VHEVGHAIVARAFGLPVALLAIASDGSSQPSIGCSAHLPIVEQLAVCAAGMEAVELLDARTDHEAGFSDQGKIIELLEQHPEAERNRLRAEARRRARQSLEEHRPALQRVSTALASARAMEAAALEAALLSRQDHRMPPVKAQRMANSD
jgi:hypothetical protein